MDLIVSGKAWAEACDPSWRGTPREESWPEPEKRARGRGSQYVYRGIDMTMARLIAEQLRVVGEALAYSDDSDAKADSRACLRAADLADAQIRKHASR